MFEITNKISDFTAKNFVKDMSRDALMSLSYRLMHKNMSTCIKDATNVTLNHLNRTLATWFPGLEKAAIATGDPKR